MALDVMVEPSGSPLPHASGGIAAFSSQSTVLRTIGRWGLTAIVLNQIIGSGIFALPGTVAARLGWLVLPAHAIAALLALLIMLAFAEVASRFSQAGGPYLYAHVAFGRFVGLQMGWMAMFVRLLSAAVQVNLLTTYIAELWPPAGRPVGSAAIAAVFLGGLTVVNLLGVTQGTRVSSMFAALKIGALLAFGAAGLVWIAAGHTIPAHAATATTPGGWLGVVLLLMFAYSGFEAALIPMGESRNPQRDAPWALLVAFAAVVVVYALVQVVVLATLPDPGATDRPLAAAGGVILGRAGSVAMTFVAITSVYGWGSAIMVAAPRLSYAMAERGDLPAVFAWVHPRYRTPWVSILAYAVLGVLPQPAGRIASEHQPGHRVSAADVRPRLRRAAGVAAAGKGRHGGHCAGCLRHPFRRCDRGRRRRSQPDSRFPDDLDRSGVARRCVGPRARALAQDSRFRGADGTMTLESPPCVSSSGRSSCWCFSRWWRRAEPTSSPAGCRGRRSRSRSRTSSSAPPRHSRSR